MAGGLIYHVLNRANARAPLFLSDADYQSFLKLASEAHTHHPIRLLAYCLMPNHWHFVLWPVNDGDLSRFVGWLSLTHAQRRHAHRKTKGTGHLYQGRFKSFPVQTDEHFLILCRYVERNPLRAALVQKAEEWRWSSLWHRQHNVQTGPPLCDWPVSPPSHWREWVNAPQSQEEIDRLRLSLQRGRPFGQEEWVRTIAAHLGIDSTLRERGRPKKGSRNLF